MSSVTLSRQQYAVLRALLFDGASNREIGRRLYISEDTVKTHMKRIFARLGVSDRLALAVAIWSGRVTVLHPPLGRAPGCDLLEEVRALQQQAAQSEEEECRETTFATASPPPSPSST